jgi:hypothetical protein
MRKSSPSILDREEPADPRQNNWVASGRFRAKKQMTDNSDRDATAIFFGAYIVSAPVLVSATDCLDSRRVRKRLWSGSR